MYYEGPNTHIVYDPVYYRSPQLTTTIYNPTYETTRGIYITEKNKIKVQADPVKNPSVQSKKKVIIKILQLKTVL